MRESKRECHGQRFVTSVFTPMEDDIGRESSSENHIGDVVDMAIIVGEVPTKSGSS